MFLSGPIHIEVVEMDKILRAPNLLATCRQLSHGGSSGMNQALDHYQALILARSVQAKGIFASHNASFVGWALLTHETDVYYYKPVPGSACFQVYVDIHSRRNGIGSRLLKAAKDLVPNEDLLVYGESGHYFFGRHMSEGVCKTVYR